MNNKGQTGVGAILIVAMTLIVGVILFTSIAQQVGPSLETVAVANQSIDTVVNDTAQYLTDYRSISGVVIFNETGDAIVPTSNYTITNNVIHPTTGALCVSILPSTTPDYKSAWQVSGTAQPLTYIDDAGGRAIAGLIAIFFALTVLVVALTPSLRGGLMDLIGKN